MAGGLEVYNADGTIALGLTTKTSRVLGSVEAAGGQQNSTGSRTDPRFASGTPFFVVSPMAQAALPMVLDVTITGTTITWKYSIVGGRFPPGATFIQCNILYGVY